MATRPRRPRPDPLDRCFQALADPTRRAVVERLAHGEASLGEIAAPFAITLPAVHKHVRILQRAGLVATRKDGRTRLCRLRRHALGDAVAWLRRYQAFWGERLDALADLLAEESEGGSDDEIDDESSEAIDDGLDEDRGGGLADDSNDEGYA
jgi:DNA-binding transcriptional ArsR family regulator